MIPKRNPFDYQTKKGVSIYFSDFFLLKGTATLDKGFPLSMSLGMSTRSVDLTIEQAIIILPSIIPL